MKRSGAGYDEAFLLEDLSLCVRDLNAERCRLVSDLSIGGHRDSVPLGLGRHSPKTAQGCRELQTAALPSNHCIEEQRGH